MGTAAPDGLRGMKTTNMDEAPSRVTELGLESLATLRPAHDFTAIVKMDRLIAQLTTTLSAGGRVHAVVSDDLLVGYSSVVPFRPVAYAGRLHHPRWEALPVRHDDERRRLDRHHVGRRQGSRSGERSPTSKGPCPRSTG